MKNNVLHILSTTVFIVVLPPVDHCMMAAMARPTVGYWYSKPSSDVRTDSTFCPGLTLVHFSAQLERFVWDRGCA
jgi:hypothetical protein